VISTLIWVTVLLPSPFHAFEITDSVHLTALIATEVTFSAVFLPGVGLGGDFCKSFTNISPTFP